MCDIITGSGDIMSSKDTVNCAILTDHQSNVITHQTERLCSQLFQPSGMINPAMNRFFFPPPSCCCRNGPTTCFSIRSGCINSALIQWPRESPIRPRDIIWYLSGPVLLSLPPAPRSHSGPRRTSRRTGSPGSSSSLRGGSAPACTQPSSRRCPLRYVSGNFGVSE